MKKVLFATIILIAIVLRFYQLGEVPVGLHRDEAFLGYNAYSILVTGKDMTGNPWPIHLESFLYSPAGYIYAAIPSIALFGLSPFSVRLPSALFGVLTVLGTYLLVIELQNVQRGKNREQRIFWDYPFLPLLSSLFVAISPWHINLSRTATENTLVVFVVTLATYFYLRYIQHKRFVVFSLSLLLFSLTYLIYQAPRAFVPFLVILLLFFGWKNIPRMDRQKAILLTALLIFVPVVLIMTSRTLSVRIRTVSIFASQETQLKIDEALREDSIAGVAPVIARLFHNKVTSYAEVVVNNYAQHFSYNFLLTDKGLPDRYRVPGAGLMYPLELMFAVIGAVALLLKSPGLALLLLGWILVAPIGSALTSDDVPNLQRTLVIFPALSIVAAYGCAWTLTQFRSFRWFRALAIVGISATLFGILSYLHSYFVQQRFHRPWYRHEGYEQLVREVNAILPQFTKAVITNHESSPTIFFLFYNRTDPRIVQEIWRRDKSADLNTLSFGQYEFSKEACPVRLITSATTPTFIGEPNVLYVNFSDCKVESQRIKEVSTIRRSDGTEVFRLIHVQ